MDAFGGFGPGVEVIDVIPDSVAVFAIDRADPFFAHFFEFAVREAEIMCGLPGVEEGAAFARDGRALVCAVVFVVRAHRESMRDSGAVEGGRIWRDGKFAPRHAARCTLQARSSCAEARELRDGVNADSR